MACHEQAMRPRGGWRVEWTRSQSIRTVGQVPFEVAILETEPEPTYLRISCEAKQLHALGMSNSAIARHLGTTDKTVAKSLAIVARAPRGPGG